MSDCADGSAVQASALAVREELRRLAANLLRVAGGATAQPDLILAQAAAFVEALAAHRAAAGRDPSAEEIAEALRSEPIPDEDGEAWPDWDRAVREMVNGALQVAAAELLAQPAEAATGRRELFAGYRRIEKMHTRHLRRVLERRTSANEN